MLWPPVVSRGYDRVCGTFNPGNLYLVPYLSTNQNAILKTVEFVVFLPQVKAQFRNPGGASEGAEMWSQEGSPMTEAMHGIPGADDGIDGAIPVLMSRLKAGCKAVPLVLVLVFVCSCVEEIAKRR